VVLEDFLDAQLSSIDGTIEVIEDRSYLTMENQGLSLCSDNHVTVSTVHIYGEGHGRISKDSGSLPVDLRFSMGRNEVRSQCGVPTVSGEATDIPILGQKPPWDVYILSGLRVHLEYALDCKSIGLITLSKAT
jgi:hypothetical protein